MSETEEAAKMAAAAAVSGGAARVLMALHGGERGVIPLLIEAGLGATLGIIAAAAATYLDASLRDIGWPLLIVAGGAGMAGALGTRLLDLVTEALRRRVG